MRLFFADKITNKVVFNSIVITIFYRSRCIACRERRRTAKHSSCSYRFMPRASQMHRGPWGNLYVIAPCRELRSRLRHRAEVPKLQTPRRKGRNASPKIQPDERYEKIGGNRGREMQCNTVMRAASNLWRNLQLTGFSNS